MDYVGLDVHKVKTQICVRDEQGKIVDESRVRTGREELVEAVKPQAPCRVLLEASTEARWVAAALSKVEGVKVIVADPNYRAMYSSRGEHKKTDKDDARALAEAARTGVWREVHLPDDAHVRLRQRHRVRATLVRTRTTIINLCRAVVRQEGFRVKSGEAEHFADRLEKLEGLPADLKEILEPAVETLSTINEQIGRCDERVAEAAKTDEGARLLVTVPYVGPVIATAFAAAVGDPKRFQKARHAGSYFGAAPRVSGSGEGGNHNGRMTKRGNSYVRGLLAQAASNILKSKKAEVKPLQDWAVRIAQKHGTVKRAGRMKNVGHKIAVGALSRRLAVIMTAMLKTKTKWDVGRFKRAPGRVYPLAKVG